MTRRGKVQLKWIENTQSRQVAFAKRRKGLFKKANELSVLCDVEVAVVVLSNTGKAYDFASGNSISKTMEHYWTNKLNSQKIACGIDPKAQKYYPECSAPCNGSNNLQYSLQRLFEALSVEHFNAIDIVQLEQQLDIALRQTRDLKAQLMMQSIGNPP